MKRIRFIAIVLTIAMLCVTVPFASAAAPVGSKAIIQPLWTNADIVNVGLSFSGAAANCSSKVVGISGTTKIVATIVLARKNANGTYTAVKTWANQSISGQTLTFSDTYAVTNGYTYRVTVTADVTRNGTTETVNNWVENNV